jgi:inorganic triphosphatase YgiF
MRVATRRARSALQAFGTIIDRDATRPLCAELKWLAVTLGQARDAEVLRDRLTADLAAIPPALIVGAVPARVTAHFTAELDNAGQFRHVGHRGITNRYAESCTISIHRHLFPAFRRPVLPSPEPVAVADNRLVCSLRGR